MNAPERAAWLAQRKSGIGGSDIAAILGISPWRTPLDVWLDKTGQQIDEPARNAEAMYWGTVLEDVVATEYATRSGAKVQRVRAMLRHPDRDWMIGNIDRAIVAPGTRVRLDAAGWLQGAAGILECKTANAYAAAEWSGPDGSDAMPVYYAAQCMWYLAIAGLDVADVAVLIGGQQYQQRRVERDDETIRGLVERAEHFWRHHVLGGIAPEPTNARDAARLFQRDDGSLRAIDDDAELLVTFNNLRHVREQLDHWQAQADGLTDALKLAIGEHAGLAINGRPVATWKAAKDSTVTNWQAAANDIGALVAPDILAATVARHTTTKPGSRRFLVK